MVPRPATDATPPAPPDDERAADPIETFTAFYERELAVQVRRATLLVGDPHTARDLVHDAFADVFARFDRLRAPGPYLNTAVLNRCRDHGRRATRRGRLTPRPPVEDQPETDPLWDALAVLPFNHRAVLVLRFHHQMTDREIAETLGCRIGSVGPWIQRGLQRLRKDLS